MPFYQDALIWPPFLFVNIMMIRKFRVLFALLFILATPLYLSSMGCASSKSGKQSYASQAQAAFQEAEEALDGGEYLEAVRRFNLIRTRFPYSRYAPLADLRIADAYFMQDKFATAIEQYRTFLKLYANHPRVTYARWRVAFSFYKQMPEDWLFLPPGYERDLDRARDARRELKFFLRQNPNTKYTKVARKYLLLSKRRLADHELYVAKFYLQRKNPRAAALRLTYLLQNYQGLGLDAPALFLLARAYLELKDVDKAAVALRDLIRVHPRSTYAAKARTYIKRHGLQSKISGK